MAGKKEIEQKEMPFVTEQIKKGAKLKRCLIKAAKTVILAIVFGVTAGVSFALVLPYVQKNGKEEEHVRESITIPRDTQPAATEPPTTPRPTETETTTPAETESTEPIENIVENVLSERSFTIEDYTALYDAMYEVVSKVNQSIVTVTSSEDKLDLFNKTYELKDEASGLIYNKTDSELLILTNAESIHSADHISVTFQNGRKCEAVLRKADMVSGMAVLVIDARLLGDDLSGYPVASLGNSYTMKQGDVAITVGNPFGYNYSMSYGVVSSVKNTAQAVDANYRLINTNILESPNGGGFLINTKGEIMGIITKKYKSEAASGITTAIAISDLKGVLEKLSNEQDILYFGIKGQDVTADIAKGTGLPQGVYISESIVGSPVYRAGVQSGDVLVEFGGVQVYSMKTFRNLLESRQPEEEVHIKVMRKGREEYIEIEFDVIIDVK
ncbi:MAG: serine protease [Lachnospiraceae bacterium]|nr:serine protease [Lachnospiraceae bacterium]